jgi:hypothetical protein
MRSLNRYEGRSGGDCSVASPWVCGMTCAGQHAIHYTLKQRKPNFHAHGGNEEEAEE